MLCVAQDSESATYAKLIAPTNLERSVAPKANSPFVLPIDEVGSKDTATRFWLIAPWENKLSVTAYRA